jgi:uncharacterized membrane protein
MRHPWFNWLRRHQVRGYVRSALWIFPVLGTLAALAVTPLIDRLDARTAPASQVDPAVALTLLATMASAMFTFIVFVFSMLLVAVQLASAQLTPRIIALMFRDPVIKSLLTVFTFVFTYVMAALVRVRGNAPHLSTRVAAYAFLVSLCLFLYMIDHVGRALRANGVLRRVGSVGREVIQSVYQGLAAPRPAPQLAEVLNTESTRTIDNVRAGSVLAFDTQGLLELATRHECVIEVVPRVGDFAAVGDPLFRIYLGGATLPLAALRRSIAIGRERTFEQDPCFALRIMVDIASKALSPAINDPTTAVLALDEIHYALRLVGQRQLDDRVLADEQGNYRLAYHTPNWNDFVSLAVTEIRQFGATSVQVTRRLRAMLENLIETLPEMRAPVLRQELALLHRTVERSFPQAEDRVMAGMCDPQGVGSGREEKTPKLGVSRYCEMQTSETAAL